MDLLSTVSAVKSELEGLLKKTDSALKDLEANKAFPIHDEKEIKKVWARAVLDFCNKHGKVAEQVLGLKSEAKKVEEKKPESTPAAKPEVIAKPKSAEEPPAKPPAKTDEEVKRTEPTEPLKKKQAEQEEVEKKETSAKAEEPKPTEDPPKTEKKDDAESKEVKKEKEEPKAEKKDEKPAGDGEGEDQEVEVPAPVKRKPRAKGRKPPSKKLLADRAKDEDLDASTIKLEKDDMPDQVSDETEAEEAPKRRATAAVPIFNAGVMGELNKALGARATRKSIKLQQAEDTSDKSAAAGASSQEDQPPKIALAKVQTPLAQVKLASPPARDNSEKKDEPEIPPWKLELQRRKKTVSTKPKIPLPQVDKEEEPNQLAAILAKRRQKSG